MQFPHFSIRNFSYFNNTVSWSENFHTQNSQVFHFIKKSNELSLCYFLFIIFRGSIIAKFAKWQYFNFIFYFFSGGMHWNCVNSGGVQCVYLCYVMYDMLLWCTFLHLYYIMFCCIFIFFNVFKYIFVFFSVCITYVYIMCVRE